MERRNLSQIGIATWLALGAFFPGDARAQTGTRVNLAAHKICKASSVEGLLTPDKAVDGPKSQGSRWGSNYGTDKNKDSAWIFVDLGKDYVLDSVAIYWEHSGAARYSLQSWPAGVDTPSYDDTGWKSFLTDTALTYSPKPIDMCLSFLHFAPVKTRYLRVRCYKRLFEFGYSIMELEAYGNEPSAAGLPTLGTGWRVPLRRADGIGSGYTLAGRAVGVPRARQALVSAPSSIRRP